MSDPLEGEVVLMDDEIKSELEQLDTPSNEIAISQMLDKAQSWLQVAKQQADAPRAIADFKAEIIAVAQYAKQKKVSEEIQLDATLMVRRAERELGVAIREGQERGEIRSERQNVTHGEKSGSSAEPDFEPSSPKEFLGKSGSTTREIYMMTDGVSDDEFNSALEAAKEEKNPSRVNINRKIKESKGEELPKTYKTQTGNQTTRTMERLTASLWGLRQSLQTIKAVDDGLDPDQVKAWIKELSSTSAELNRIRNLLKAGQ